MKYQVTIETPNEYDPDDLAFNIFELIGEEASVVCEEVENE